MTKMQARREQQGMSREDLASKARVSHGGIVKWENETRLPRVDNAIRIAKALKTTTEKLWGEAKGK